MGIKQFEVVYIDKFEDLLSADLFRDQVRKRFGLRTQEIARMSSGLPVVVKKNLDFEKANLYRSAIRSAGGICWVQEHGPSGKHSERRLDKRRDILDRRTCFRASSTFPDRRRSCGRRGVDKHFR